MLQLAIPNKSNPLAVLNLLSGVSPKYTVGVIIDELSVLQMYFYTNRFKASGIVNNNAIPSQSRP